MIDLKYSLVVEATEEPDYFGFYSPELEGFSGIGHSVEDCLYKAPERQRARRRHHHGLPGPAVNPARPALSVLSCRTVHRGRLDLTYGVLSCALEVMTVTLDIPDDIAGQLAAPGQELSRAALEALALEAYRRGALSQLQVGCLLGLSRIQTEDFLAQHIDLYNYEPGELKREADALVGLSDRQR